MTTSDRLLAAGTGYDPAHFAALFAIEERHFWFRTRKRTITSLMGQLTASLPSGYRILEVGCGTGNALSGLEHTCGRGKVAGMDLHAEGLRYARRRTLCCMVQADVHWLPFNGAFDIIGLFDVLEHLPDDRLVLRSLREALAPHGTLVLTVPAHAALWSYFDEVSNHVRRYGLCELQNKLHHTGFRVDYISLYMATTYPLLWLGRRLAKAMHRRMANG